MSQIIKFEDDKVRVEVKVIIAVGYKNLPLTAEIKQQRQIIQITFDEQARAIEKDLVELINEKGLPNPVTN